MASDKDDIERLLGDLRTTFDEKATKVPARVFRNYFQEPRASATISSRLTQLTAEIEEALRRNAEAVVIREPFGTDERTESDGIQARLLDIASWLQRPLDLSRFGALDEGCRSSIQANLEKVRTWAKAYGDYQRFYHRQQQWKEKAGALIASLGTAPYDQAVITKVCEHYRAHRAFFNNFLSEDSLIDPVIKSNAATCLNEQEEAIKAAIRANERALIFNNINLRGLGPRFLEEADYLVKLSSDRWLPAAISIQRFVRDWEKRRVADAHAKAKAEAEALAKAKADADARAKALAEEELHVRKIRSVIGIQKVIRDFLTRQKVATDKMANKQLAIKAPEAAATDARTENQRILEPVTDSVDALIKLLCPKGKGANPEAVLTEFGKKLRYLDTIIAQIRGDNPRPAGQIQAERNRLITRLRETILPDNLNKTKKAQQIRLIWKNWETVCDTLPDECLDKLLGVALCQVAAELDQHTPWGIFSYRSDDSVPVRRYNNLLSRVDACLKGLTDAKDSDLFKVRKACQDKLAACLKRFYLVDPSNMASKMTIFKDFPEDVTREIYTQARQLLEQRKREIPFESAQAAIEEALTALHYGISLRVHEQDIYRPAMILFVQLEGFFKGVDSTKPESFVTFKTQCVQAVAEPKIRQTLVRDPTIWQLFVNFLQTVANAVFEFCNARLGTDYRPYRPQGASGIALFDTFNRNVRSTVDGLGPIEDPRPKPPST